MKFVSAAQRKAVFASVAASKAKGKMIAGLKAKMKATVAKLVGPLQKAGWSPKMAKGIAITTSVFLSTPLPAPGFGLVAAGALYGGSVAGGKAYKTAKNILKRSRS